MDQSGILIFSFRKQYVATQQSDAEAIPDRSRIGHIMLS
jgi:hypothetical protein